MVMTMALDKIVPLMVFRLVETIQRAYCFSLGGYLPKQGLDWTPSSLASISG